MNKSLSGRLREFKNKGQVQLGNPKSGRCRLRERSLMNGKGGRNQSWLRTRLVARRALTVERGKAKRTKLKSGSVFPIFL